MSCLRNIRLITFDVTNTLLQFRASPGKQYGEIGALFGVRCDNNDLVKNFKANWYAMNKKYPNFGCNSDIEWQQWWRILIAETFAKSGAKIPEEKVENFTNHLLELYKTSIIWQHCNGSIDLLKYLSKEQQKQQQKTGTSFAMGVIANFDPRLPSLLKNMKIDQHFQFVLNSYEAKVEKPNAKIFEMAISAAKLQQLKPEECLHIGDGPTTDYLAAKTVGWHSALVHEKSANYLVNKYGSRIIDTFIFPSLYDFHRKVLSDAIVW